MSTGWLGTAQSWICSSAFEPRPSTLCCCLWGTITPPRGYVLRMSDRSGQGQVIEGCLVVPWWVCAGGAEIWEVPFFATGSMQALSMTPPRHSEALTCTPSCQFPRCGSSLSHCGSLQGGGGMGACRGEMWRCPMATLGESWGPEQQLPGCFGKGLPNQSHLLGAPLGIVLVSVLFELNYLLVIEIKTFLLLFHCWCLKFSSSLMEVLGYEEGR